MLIRVACLLLALVFSSTVYAQGNSQAPHGNNGNHGNGSGGGTGGGGSGGTPPPGGAQGIGVFGPWDESMGWASGLQNQNTYCADFIGAFHQMVLAISAVMPNATFVFNAADGTIMPNWQACYPGDKDTDYVAIDTYDGNRSSLEPAAARWQQDQVPGITESQALALAHRKGWAVPEWAIGRMGDNPLFVANMAAAMELYRAYGLPVFSGYWNSGDPNSGYAGYMNTSTNPLSWAEFTRDFHAR